VSMGNALDYDGSNDYVQTDTSPILISGSYTVEAWAKPSTTSGTLSIVSSRNAGASFDFKLTGGNVIHGDIGTGSSWLTTTADAIYTYTANQWLHIAYVVTPTGYTIYVNGQQVSTNTFSGTPLFINTTSILDIGSLGGYAEFFTGSIDEVKIYNVALTQGQIQSDMANATPVLPGNIKFYYNFNTGTANGSNPGANVLYDQSSNALNGTLYNFALSGNTSNWIENSNAPVGQTLCNGTTVADLTATGTALKWYTASTGGSALASTTALSTGTYYVSQTLNSCESTRTAVAVTISTTAAPAALAQTLCNGATVANLTATGTALKWYTAATGGSVLAGTTVLSTGSYYVSQTLNGCESTRTPVAVTINTTAAPTASAQTLCNGATVANLTATGTALQWYTAATGGSALASTTALSPSTYYVSQTLNSCESVRTAVAVTINPTTAVPTATAQTYANGTTVASLVATGTNLQWYSASTGGTALASTTPLTTATYYVSQTANGCESTRTAVSITVTYPIRYVKPTASGTGDGTSWANASANLQGMIDIANVQQVWVAAGTYYPSGNGFHLVNNVAVYGGFNGTETTLSQRNWVTNLTILGPYNQGLIINNGSGLALNATAILDGFTLTGANTNGYGGAISNNVSSPTLRNLIIKGNAAYWGGGVFNYDNSSPTLINVVISGNKALYYGSGIYNGSNSSPILINVTISGNNNQGVYTAGGSPVLRNSIVYGNGQPISGITPTYYNCLIQWVNNTSNGNINDIDPLFVNAPDPYSAPFTTGDYHLLPCSPALNMGNNSYVPVGTTTDLDGYARIYNTLVDIGAYELQQLPSAPAAPTASPQTYCGGTTVAGLVATGTALKWYTVATGGSALAGTTALSTGTYYASQTINGCEGSRVAVPITIITTPPPTASAQAYATGATVSTLVATGTNLQWYTTSTGGTALAPNTLLTTATYYVSQTLNGCESFRTSVSLTPLYPILYVKPTASGTGDGTSWANASSSLQSMIDVVGVQQVWVAAGTYYPPGNGFHLVNNVAVYGGFNGTETALSQRNWTTNVTTLSGYNQFLIINNTYSTDYVLTSTAVLDGFTLSGANRNDDGGAIYNRSASPTFRNLIIKGNSAYSGGAMCNYENSSPTLINVIISGNKALYTGSGIQNASSSSPTLINVTISGNNNNGIYNSGGSSTILRNSIVYGNGQPIFGPVTYYNSLIQWGNDYTNGNINDVNPLFVNAPEFYNAPFTTGDYRVLPCSPVLNAGNNSYIPVGVTSDLAGNTRIYDTIVDIGAYELQQVASIPVAPTASAQTFCGATTVAGLVATGSNLQWYSVATGGTPLASTTSLISATYYVSQTVNGCTGPRTAVAVTVYNTAAPTASAQTFCNSATVANLTATGTALKWYTAASGGSALASAAAITTGTYYVSQTLNSCESVRTAVAVTINTTAAPIALAQSFCNSATVANLVATGAGLKWYTSSTGGSALASAAALSTGTYYVSQTLNGCESTRTAVAVTINTTAAPTFSSQSAFCNGATVSDLVATGTNLKWYSTATGGSELAGTTLLSSGNYYVSQTLNGCESNRITVYVIIQTVTPLTGNTNQTFCSSSANLDQIVVDGFATGYISWYTTPTGGESLPTSTLLVDGTTYYGAKRTGTCESAERLGITVNIVEKIWTGTMDSDWNNNANWCEYTIPGAGDNVVIPATDANNHPLLYMPVVSTGVAHAKSITITDAAATLTVNSGATLRVENTITS
ncbi:LamG-like jellyroll fold domain-containing protein, partial [Flavobacterium sp. RHBU_24]|uniref:Ig-like domain-containing protein n=1 Tax=Flavobacterium sp. RHBU_24 TaxID=3391185 RepID=UPI003984C9E3